MHKNQVFNLVFNYFVFLSVVDIKKFPFFDSNYCQALQVIYKVSQLKQKSLTNNRV